MRVMCLLKKNLKFAFLLPIGRSSFYSLSFCRPTANFELCKNFWMRPADFRDSCEAGLCVLRAFPKINLITISLEFWTKSPSKIITFDVLYKPQVFPLEKEENLAAATGGHRKIGKVAKWRMWIKIGNVANQTNGKQRSATIWNRALCKKVIFFGENFPNFQPSMFYFFSSFIFVLNTKVY